MTKSKFTLTTAAAVIAVGLGSAAMAQSYQTNSASQPGDGPYVRLNAGAVFMNDRDVDIQTGAGSTFGTLNPSTGYAVGGAVGYQYNNWLRLESEVTWRSNGVDDATIGGATFDGNDDYTSLALMENALISYPSVMGLTPYVGGGVGAARLGLAGEHDWNFAYQAIGGVERPIGPQTTLGIEYRYFGTQDGEFNTPLATTKIDYSSHNAMVTLRRSF